MPDETTPPACDGLYAVHYCEEGKFINYACPDGDVCVHHDGVDGCVDIHQTECCVDLGGASCTPIPKQGLCTSGPAVLGCAEGAKVTKKDCDLNEVCAADKGGTNDCLTEGEVWAADRVEADASAPEPGPQGEEAGPEPLSEPALAEVAEPPTPRYNTADVTVGPAPKVRKACAEAAGRPTARIWGVAVLGWAAIVMLRRRAGRQPRQPG
jgi:hypothetical protein